MKKRKLNFGETKRLLRNFNELPKDYLTELAKTNHMSIDELKYVLQERCYYVNNLGITQMKSFRKEIEHMDDEELAIVEKINQKTLEQIKEHLDSVIVKHNEQIRQMRVFNKAWETRKADVLNQLIDEGKVQPRNGYFLTDVSIMRELSIARNKLAEELGLDIVFKDPFASPRKYT